MYHLYHGEPNTLSLKVLMVLHETESAFESHWLDFSNPETWCAEPFSRSKHWNLGVEIGSPLLVDGALMVSDSTFIGYYIDERSQSPRLLPQDAYGRWQVSQWARFSAEVLTTAVHTLGCAKVAASTRQLETLRDACLALPQQEQRQQWRALIENEYPEDLLKDCERRICLAVERVDTALTNATWLAGATLSLADIDMFTGLRAARYLSGSAFDESRTPHLNDWWQRMQARPSLSAALAYSKTKKPELAFAPGPENSRWG